MTRARADIDVDDLLKILLLLVIAWLVLEVVETIVGTLASILHVAQPVLAVAVLVLILLYLLDRI